MFCAPLILFPTLTVMKDNISMSLITENISTMQKPSQKYNAKTYTRFSVPTFKQEPGECNCSVALSSEGDGVAVPGRCTTVVQTLKEEGRSLSH